MDTEAALTPRQRQILAYIKEEIRSKGYPPSVREIGKAVGLRSSSTVHGHLEQLAQKGLLRRDPAKPRAMEVVGSGPREDGRVAELPIIGRVAAGSPILAQENWEGTLSLPVELVGSGEHFLLQVRGDSMVGAGILDGDVVIVRAQPTAENGEIVVALLGGEATVKRLYRRDGHVELRPENPAMAPIITPAVDVVGKVVGLIRRL
ncbi:MAG: transcriptional repressor LexA [Syntrophomonadaceae bacterium]|nr:transcriptional repressor LexA [Syntrophomonadaceae bacterium]